jgi:predicted DsbA family dithiol-disulfide isomerase
MQKQLSVDVWSDVACPWCYVGKRHLEGALARFAHRDAVRVVWRAFELDPGAPRVRQPRSLGGHPQSPGVSHVERIAKKYGMSVAQAEAATKRLVDAAAEDGITMRFDRIAGGNTFDAHRVIALAGERGMQDAVKERLLLGYFTQGEAIGEPQVLVRLAGEAGLPEDEVRAMLAGTSLTDEVRADEAKAAELGIHGVPFFVIAGRYGISGAQPADVLLAALEKGWSGAGEVTTGDGAACSVEGCA